MLGSTGPIESKVKAAAGGSLIGVALANLVIWLCDRYWFTTEPVPDVISVAVMLVIPTGLTFLGGFLARHTYRRDRDAVAGVHSAEVERLADRDARRADPHRRDPDLP